MADRFYIMAMQKPENGRTWDFIAGPYETHDRATASKEYATLEYSARNDQPEWFEGADVRVVTCEMPIPTALGAIEAAGYDRDEFRVDHFEHAVPEAALFQEWREDYAAAKERTACEESLDEAARPAIERDEKGMER